MKTKKKYAEECVRIFNEINKILVKHANLKVKTRTQTKNPKNNFVIFKNNIYFAM